MNRLAAVITCHAWNSDGTKLALCPNSNDIQVYSHINNQFTLEQTLSEHDQVVTGIDWAPKSNRIVSCSQDRNAYVWTAANEGWKPTLVILRVNRAATHVKWSPEENKFAVASGAKLVSICYFEEDNDWWVSKHIKKHKSTVTHLDWHPNNCLIATGSTDFKARVFPAYIKGVDKKAPDTPWGNKLVFGEPLCEFETNGSVQSIQWSHDGNQLAYCGQDSRLYVADISSGEAKVDSAKYNELPLRDILWVHANAIVGVGYDCSPMYFQNTDGWKLVRRLDTGETAQISGKQNSAMNVFKNKVDKGTETSTETKLNTRHQNTITNIQPFKRSEADVTQYSTSGLDGCLVIWDTPK